MHLGLQKVSRITQACGKTKMEQAKATSHGRAAAGEGFACMPRVSSLLICRLYVFDESCRGSVE